MLLLLMVSTKIMKYSSVIDRLVTPGGREKMIGGYVDGYTYVLVSLTLFIIISYFICLFCTNNVENTS